MKAPESQPLMQGLDPFGVPWTAQLEVKMANEDVRRGFVRKVYGILATQLLWTVLIATPFQFVGKLWLISNSWLFTFSMVMSLVLICALVCCRDAVRKWPTNEILLLGFTTCEGILVGFICAHYSWQSIIFAGGVTCVVFLGLTIYAMFTETDFTGYGIYLFMALNVLCCWSFAIMMLAVIGVELSWGLLIFDLCAVLMFSMYIVYDTQMIIGGKHEHQFTIDDYVIAALTLYLDIIQLFLHLLRLMGESD